MSPSESLALLRDPSPEEASRWHKPKKKPAAERVKQVAAFLLEDETVKLVKRSDDGCCDVRVDTGDGTSLRIAMRHDSIDVRLGPFLLQPDQQPVPVERYLLEVSELIEVLQLGTGFYVFSDRFFGFDPQGTCPSCGLEVFGWQEECAICDVKIHAVRPGEDEYDGRAARIVEVLLRRKLLELASPRGRRNVERTVALYFVYGTMAPEVLEGLLLDMDDVAELYCDVATLNGILQRIK